MPEDDVLEHDGLSRPNTRKGRMQRLALARMLAKEAAGEIPTNIRFVFYEFEQAGLVSKQTLKLDGTPGKRAPAADLTAALTDLRELGLIPWEWIVDESRDVDAWPQHATVLEFLLDGDLEWVHIDRFPGLARPVILCEARTVGGVLARGVAREYRVTVAATGGQINSFLRTQVASYLMNDERVLYIGDHDLAGNAIEENSRRVLEHETGRTFTEDTWERLMITDEQCQQLVDRGVLPIQKTDKRFRPPRHYEAFEAEALGQAFVMQTVRDRLEQLAPEPLADVQRREGRQRAKMLRVLRAGLPPE
jgi:hypothetical protein